MPRVEKMRAFGQRALHRPHAVVAPVKRVGNAFRSEEKRASGVEITKIVRKKFTNKILKNCESSRHAHKIRVNSASARCANRRTSLHLSTESDVRSDPKKASSRRRDHANFAPKSRERNANFSELRRASRRKNACIRPACVALTACRHCTCSSAHTQT